MFFVTQSRGSIDPGQGGLYKYDQGPIFPSMTPALKHVYFGDRNMWLMKFQWKWSIWKNPDQARMLRFTSRLPCHIMKMGTFYQQIVWEFEA